MSLCTHEIHPLSAPLLPFPGISLLPCVQKVVAALLAFFCATVFAKGPNLVVLLADDLGWGSVGYNEPSPRARTPNIDAMAQNGLVFERFYAGGPVCSPTRASIFTGRTPNRDCIWTAYVNRLSPNNRDTITQAAKRAGYRTFHGGKYHLGDITGVDCHDAMLQGNPGDFNVDTFYSASGSGPSATYNCWTAGKENGPHGCAGGAENYTGDTYNTCLLEYFTTTPGGGHPGNEVHNDTNVQTVDVLGGSDASLIMTKFEAFLTSATSTSSPFVAHVWFHSPHLPHNAAPEWVAAYSNDSSLDPLHVDYYGTISDMDHTIGQIRALLREKHVEQDTLVWFLSDNGCERQQPGNEAIRGRLTGCKRWLREGGIRVPGIAEWPAVISPNSTTTVPAVSMDILPTFLEAAGISRVDPSWPLDGASLLSLFKSPSSPFTRPPIGFATELQKLPGDEEKDCFPVGGYEDFDMHELDSHLKRTSSVSAGSYPFQHQQAWVDGDLKLWGSGDTSLTYFLYNITEDPLESRDLKSTLPHEYAAMRTALQRWINSTINSTMYETKCISSPLPPNPTPSSDCDFHENQGLVGADLYKVEATTKELCCGICRETTGCAAADWNDLDNANQFCHLKAAYDPKTRTDGSVGIVPHSS